MESSYKKCIIAGCTNNRMPKGIRKGERAWRTVCRTHYEENKKRRAESPFAKFLKK